VYLAVELIGSIEAPVSYMMMNFGDTIDSIQALYCDFLAQGKICHLYPMPAKLGKQFEYADKK
jgi:hypothetical protein